MSIAAGAGASANPVRSGNAHDDPAEAAYLQSCNELRSAIGALESSLLTFVGGKDGAQPGEIFPNTRQRLAKELAAERSSAS